MRKIPYVFAILILLATTAQTLMAETAGSVAQMDQILERYREILLRSETPDIDSILKDVSTQQADGSWEDVDYQSNSRSEWQGSVHLIRAGELALGIASETIPTERQSEVLHSAISAIDYWNQHRFRAPNWWWNEIGIPRAMRDCVVLLRDKLPESTLDGAIEVIGQLDVKGTGANLTWSAELSVHHACLTRNPKQLENSIQRIWNEITVGQPEGIQEDWSFFQHGARLQTHHYGASFVAAVCKAAWQMRGTTWAIPQDKRAIMDQYLLEGPRWMSRGIYNSPGTVDRQISRYHGLTSLNEILTPLIFWKDVSPIIQPEMDAFVRSIEGTSNHPVLGFRHYPISDFSVYHTASASIFLKTVSSRTFLTESINSENLRGTPFLNCGDHYVIANGNEYLNTQPFWDWSQLPGLSTTLELEEQERTDFVGGLGNGESGMTAMDFKRSGETQSFHVRKLWVFHNDTMLCLLGGWEVEGNEVAISTSIEQCRAQGPVAYANKEDSRITVSREIEETSADWVAHNNLGYLPLDESPLTVSAKTIPGNWQSIRKASSPEEIKEAILKVTLRSKEEKFPSGYAVLLGRDPRQVSMISDHPEWEVIKNDGEAQAVRFEDGTVFIAFYQASNDIHLPIQADQPCLALLDDEGLWLCDPSHQGISVSIKWDNEIQTIDLPSKGFGWFVAK